MESPKPFEEYESTVKGLVEILAFACQELGNGKVRGGKTNRITGASGFAHQIDVSIHFPEHLVLLECKCLSRPVEVHHALTFASRLRDIQAAIPEISVSGSLVSTQSVRVGAFKIADYFEFNIDQVMSLNEYVISIVKRHFVGLKSGIVFGDHLVAHVIQDGG